MNSVQKFRKKPIVVEAIQFDGTPKMADIIREWSGRVNRFQHRLMDSWVNGELHFHIHTHKSKETAKPGDWIIKGTNGEFYFREPGIFKATYQLVIEKD